MSAISAMAAVSGGFVLIGRTSPLRCDKLIIPFEIDPRLAGGIGADIGLDLDIRGNLDFDRGGAAAGCRALLGADEDAAGDIAAGAQARRGGRTTLAGLDIQAV